jgi:hypothetical protein
MFAKCKGVIFLPFITTTIIYFKYVHEEIYMTSGSKYRIVGWGLLLCSGLFWSLLGLLPPVSGLFMGEGESALGSVTEDVA